MTPLTFEQARASVIEKLREAGVRGQTEMVPLLDADGRVLAEEVRADRDYPPQARSIRDGFAVRARDLPGELRVIGEVRAGEPADLAIGPGEAIEIMTGAPVPEGADAILMVEYAEISGRMLRSGRQLSPGEFINPGGVEARAGQVLLPRGLRIDFAHVILLAMVGRTEVEVHCRPVRSISPERSAYSTIRTASAPSGTGAPVMISTASPGPMARSAGSPARTSPMTRSSPGRSRARRAKPSRIERACGG